MFGAALWHLRFFIAGLIVIVIVTHVRIVVDNCAVIGIVIAIGGVIRVDIVIVRCVAIVIDIVVALSCYRCVPKFAVTKAKKRSIYKPSHKYRCVPKLAFLGTNKKGKPKTYWKPT